MLRTKLSWLEITNLLDVLEKDLGESKNEFDSIYGVPRGGLIPAVMLCYRLQLPLERDIQKVTPRTLVVDDICDTGGTLKRISILLGFTPNAVSLVARSQSAHMVNYAAQVVDNEKWIVFPWETEESSKLDGTSLE